MCRTKMVASLRLSHIAFSTVLLCLFFAWSRGPVSLHYLHVRSVPQGAAEWPVALLTLRAAVTLHHPSLHLGWRGHLATEARVRRSWTRGYWEINRYASAQPRELPGWLTSPPLCDPPPPSPLIWPNEDDAVLTFPHLAVCGYPVTG